MPVRRQQRKRYVRVRSTKRRTRSNRRTKTRSYRKIKKRSYRKSGIRMRGGAEEENTNIKIVERNIPKYSPYCLYGVRSNKIMEKLKSTYDEANKGIPDGQDPIMAVLLKIGGMGLTLHTLSVRSNLNEVDNVTNKVILSAKEMVNEKQKQENFGEMEKWMAGMMLKEATHDERIRQGRVAVENQEEEDLRIKNVQTSNAKKISDIIGEDESKYVWVKV